MEHVQLGIAESAIMFALMARATEVRGPELNEISSPMNPNRRKKLGDDLGFIDFHKGYRGAFYYSLTDGGWAWCANELGNTPPKGASPALKTLYTVLGGVGKYLAASDKRLYEVFGAVEVGEDGADVVEESAELIPVRTRIITAYYDLAQSPGAWVSVTDLRAALPDIERVTLDAELVVYQREPGVSLIQQENRMLLTDADRAAAVLVGAQLCHLLAIEE